MTKLELCAIILLLIAESLFSSGFQLFLVMRAGKKKQRVGWYPKRCMIVYIASFEILSHASTDRFIILCLIKKIKYEISKK